MKILQNSYDLGHVKLGEVFTFSTEILNDSTSPVKVSEIRPGCGSCTTANIDKSSLNTDEKLLLTCAFTPNSTGYQVKTVKLSYKLGDTNEQRDCIFTFSANVHQ